jgi:hypothetical protein
VKQASLSLSVDPKRVELTCIHGILAVQEWWSSGGEQIYICKLDSGSPALS